MKRKNYKENFTRKSMKIGKRGQMTIFIIIGIIIIAAVVLYFLFRPRLGGIFEGAFSPNSYLSACVEPEVRRGVDLLSKQGSYRDVEEGSVLYQGEKIKYLCYIEGYYKTCVVQQPMIKNNFESQLNDMVKGKADQCMRNLIAEYERRGYKVNSGGINSEVSIIPSKILVVFNSQLTVNKETTQKFDRFDVGIDSEMYDLLFISSSIVDYESSLGDSASELYLQYYPNLRIEKIKLDDGTKIYKVRNVITKEEFKFASRSLSWPAGYGLEGK